MPTVDPAEAAMDRFAILMDTDPYLEYQPAFAYSLPIQLFVNGITITLLAVLLMHLLCTWPPRALGVVEEVLTTVTTQYHYPLAPLNYCLQLSSIVVVFISVIVKIWFVLQYSSKSGDIWPYDLDYVAVSIPHSSWTLAQDAAWFLLQALNNGLSNVSLLSIPNNLLIIPDHTYSILDITISLSDRSTTDHLHPRSHGHRLLRTGLYSSIRLTESPRYFRFHPKRPQLDPPVDLHHRPLHLGIFRQ